jgi:hypothetical protein
MSVFKNSICDIPLTPIPRPLSPPAEKGEQYEDGHRIESLSLFVGRDLEKDYEFETALCYAPIG